MAVSISSNELVIGALGLVDHATGNTITGASFSNVTATSGDTNVFTVLSDTSTPPNITVTGVGAGTANLTVTADVTYTDPNTGQPVTQTGKTAIIAVTVVAGAISTDLVVNFGTPQPKS